MAKPYSPTRFATTLGLTLAAGAALWGGSLAYGLLGGYFRALPLVPLFFLAVGIVSVRIMRRIVYGKTTRLVSQLLLVTIGRLITDVGFTALGLYLLPKHHLAFVATVLICYILTLLLSVRALLQPQPNAQA